MEITDQAQLEMEFLESSKNDDLPDEQNNRSIYAPQSDFESLTDYALNFEPYITLAKECGMSSMSIKKSPVTNRFYLSNINFGGHFPMFELRPIKLAQINNLELLKELLSNNAYNLGRVINREPNYKI